MVAFNEEVHALILNNSRATTYAVANQFQINHSSISQIMHQDFTVEGGYKPTHKTALA